MVGLWSGYVQPRENQGFCAMQVNAIRVGRTLALFSRYKTLRARPTPKHDVLCTRSVLYLTQAAEPGARGGGARSSDINGIDYYDI